MRRAWRWCSPACAISGTDHESKRDRPMNILVVGSGGREHALAWKLAEPESVERVYVAPGNAGTALEPKLENVPLDPMDIEGLAQFAQEQGLRTDRHRSGGAIGCRDCGPIRRAQLPCFGPTAGAAQLEGSNPLPRIFSRGMTSPPRPMQCLPTSSRLCLCPRARRTHCHQGRRPRRGKGVIVAMTLDEARWPSTTCSPITSLVTPARELS